MSDEDQSTVAVSAPATDEPVIDVHDDVTNIVSGNTGVVFQGRNFTGGITISGGSD